MVGHIRTHLYPYYSVIGIVLTGPCGGLSMAVSRGFARSFIFFAGHFPCLETRKLPSESILCCFCGFLTNPNYAAPLKWLYVCSESSMSVISRCIEAMLKGYLCSFLLPALFPQVSHTRHCSCHSLSLMVGYSELCRSVTAL